MNSQQGRVEKIFICKQAGEALSAKNNATLIKAKGIEGDRYFHQQGTFSKALKATGDFEVTLIAVEEITAFNATTQLNYKPEAFRRNIVTAGIHLNDLVGKTFKIGDAVLYGVRLCEPCAHLAALIGQDIMKHMVHKAGLRAIIQQSGNISINSHIAEY